MKKKNKKMITEEMIRERALNIIYGRGVDSDELENWNDAKKQLEEENGTNGENRNSESTTD